MMITVIGRIERAARRVLVALLGMLLGVRQRPVVLPSTARILVIRLDERVGNLLLLTPLLSSLRARFPEATIHLLGNAKGRRTLDGHPALDAFVAFRKRAVLASDGPVGTVWRLRRAPYNLVVDASNPTDPSATQVILTRLSGAKHTVGADQPGFGRLFSAPAAISHNIVHEIDLRLALLAPVPGQAIVRTTSAPLPSQAPSQPVADLLTSHANTFAVVNVGARLPEKRLSPQAYANLGDIVHAAGLTPVFSWGPSEGELARAAADLCDTGVMAPPTTVEELKLLFEGARFTITCDTGPMHVAVAVNSPTLGLFVSTSPARYGYSTDGHGALDIRDGLTDERLKQVAAWVRGHAD